MITSGLTNKTRFLGNGARKVLDAHKYRGSLKSSMESITQIYSSTQGEHKNINKTLEIEASLSITLVYQQTQQRNGDGSDLIRARKKTAAVVTVFQFSLEIVNEKLSVAKT
jgi:hypothetical protein